jgi:hypothetical protein
LESNVGSVRNLGAWFEKTYVVDTWFGIAEIAALYKQDWKTDSSPVVLRIAKLGSYGREKRTQLRGIAVANAADLAEEKTVHRED